MPESLGVKLRVAREAKGLSIDQMATITKINSSFIQALEDGRWDLLPSRIYLKPFTKLCGEALGLDINELYEKIDGLASEEVKRQEPFVMSSIPPPKKGIDYKLPIVLAALLVVTVLIAFAVKTNKMDFEKSDSDNVVPARGFMRRTDAKWEKSWEIPVANPMLLQSQRLRLEAAEETWACIVADKDTVYKGAMPASSGRTFTADSVFLVTLSRNKGVAAYFNGVKVAEIGAGAKKLNNFIIKPAVKDESVPDEAE